MADLHVPEEWRQLLGRLEAGPPAVMVVGASDCGKSVLSRWLGAQRAASGLATWLIDADVGQSSLGPPGSIGCARVSAGDLGDLTAFFVGDVSPRRAVAATLEAFVGALRAASEAGPRFVVADTTGWVSSADAVALKLAKAALIGEASLVMIEAKDELRALRRAWREQVRFPVQILRPVPEVVARSATERRAHREASFRAHLSGAVTCEIDLAEVAVSGSGRLHLPRPAMSSGLLLGLNDAEGRLLSIGILQDFDGVSGRLTCLCRPEGASASEVRFGRLRLEPDGRHFSEADSGNMP